MELPAVSMFTEPVRIRTHRAALLIDQENPSYRLERDRGGFEMKSDPIRMELDNRAFFDSLGLKSIGGLADDLVQRGKEAALESTARYCREGDLLANPKSGGVSEIILQRMTKSIDTMLVFIPEPPSVSWEGGDVSIEYTPDRLRFDWSTHSPKIEYQPYSIEFNAE
jgi:hypothetical protein